MFNPDKFRRLRAAKKLTTTKLGNLIGVASGTISTWENGLREPRKSAYDAMANALGCSVGDFVDDWTGSDAPLVVHRRDLTLADAALAELTENWRYLTHAQRGELVDLSLKMRHGKYEKNHSLMENSA
ncbi:MAG: helix-turn-helix domain-containing protein [Planctomycetota bacterium]|jgi:transcriptional regulator with XRE-family HTH domain|nr:helix-turn-helix domain-containing protein [Planctomycetota bacterium]